LLALRAVRLAPNVESAASGGGHLGQDRFERNVTVERGAQEVLEYQLGSSGCGEARECDGGGRSREALKKLTTGVHQEKRVARVYLPEAASSILIHGPTK
jgi:hypothetical protein